jgi:hypothetical protein
LQEDVELCGEKLTIPSTTGKKTGRIAAPPSYPDEKPGLDLRLPVSGNQ